jgi:hypothetical protein
VCSQSRDLSLQFGSSARIRLSSGQSALKVGEMLSFVWRHGWSSEKFTVAGGKAVRHASVDPDTASRWRPINGRWNFGEHDVPAAGPVTFHSVRLHIARWAGPAEPYPPNLGDKHVAPASVQSSDMTGPYGNDPEAFVDTLSAPARSSVRTAAKALHRLRKVAKGLLLHSEGTRCEPFACGSGLGQLRTLGHVSRRWTPVGSVPVRLFECEIPNESGVCAVLEKPLFLCGRRVKPELHQPMVEIRYDTLDVAR